MDPQALQTGKIPDTSEIPKTLSICQSCHIPILSQWYFCPNCGKKLKAMPLSTSLGRQIYVYVLSIFLPPMGIIYGYRYFKQGDTKSLIVGFIAMVLTVGVLSYTVIVSIQLVHQFQGIVNGQLNLPSTQSIITGIP